MANKQKQMLAVWGSPGGGKTVTAVKLALELSKRKKNVVLVFTDVTAPTLPAVVSEKKLPDVSVGELLAAPGMTQEQVLKTCVPCEKNPYISFLGYKAGENVFTHAEYSKEKAVDMLVLLRHIADYVIVDCTSLLTGNVLATTALEVADDVLRVCSCDLKAISYFSSYLSLVADRKFKPEQHIKVLSNTRPYQGGSEYENSFGGVKYRLPYLSSLEEQAATLKLLEPLSGKEAKTYEPTAAGACGDTPLHVALLDLGCKNNIVRCLQKRGCRVTVLPGTATAAQLAALNPDGLMLSNGPATRPKMSRSSPTSVRCSTPASRPSASAWATS